MYSKLFLVVVSGLFCCVFAISAHAQSQTGTVAAPAPKPQAAGEFKLKAGIKSSNATGRILDEKDERFKQKHEYFLGAAHKSGWGGYGQLVTSGTSYNNSSKDKLSAGDPSITVLHPDFFKSETLKLSGQFRRYFAFTDRSKNREQEQYAYYFYTTYSMPGQWVLWNQIAPRYFGQAFYKVGDSMFYTDDFTTITKKMTDWFSFGFAQWTQVEWHNEAPTGTSIDLITFLKFSPSIAAIAGSSANFSIEPRLVMPAHVRNTVYDAPSRVSLNSMRAEVFAQMSL